MFNVSRKSEKDKKKVQGKKFDGYASYAHGEEVKALLVFPNEMSFN